MYSLAGWSFVLPAVYAPACADSRSGLMSGCLCIRWPDGALSFQRFMLRRVLTAAVGLCRGVYVFFGRVEPIIRSGMYHIIHAEMLSRLFMGFSAGCFSLSRPLCSVNLSWTIFAHKTTSRGTIPHIISNYPRAHYNAGLNTSAAVCRRRYLVSVRNLSIRCACNQTKVCRRKCSDRRLPNESVPTEVFWLAASDGSVQSGGFRHFILLPQIPLLRLFLNLPVSG